MHILDKPILPPANIGVLGDGQLGRMFALAALQMGYKVMTFGPDNSCAVDICKGSTVARYDDERSLSDFIRRCDVLTLEFENIPASVFKIAKELGKTIYPGQRALEVSQCRTEEKKVARELGFKTADYWIIDSEGSFLQADLTFPLILKTNSLGYDGKGQKRVSNLEELAKAWNDLKKAPCIAEAVVDFETELSVIVARSINGEMETYEPFENRHTDGILAVTQWPWHNQMTERQHYIHAANVAENIAQRLAEELDVVGLLAVEFFLTKDGEVLVNEIAPRPHNTGHITIDCALTSQFEQHVRAICGLPLGDPAYHTSGTMYNIIGTHDIEKKFIDNPDAKIHRYGKAPREGRKIGHITVLKDTTPLRGS